MNSGIYALYWWDQDLVYIGLSQNLDIRRTEHFKLMLNNKHTNYKVQSAFNRFGQPEFIILEHCLVSELPEKEIYWCHEFDALGKNGLCLVEPGIVGFGTNSNASKYSKIQILRVFSFLYNTEYTYQYIYTKTKVSTHTIADIKKSVSHIWLKEAFPHKYALMLKRTTSSNNILKNSLRPASTALRSSTGEVFIVSNIREFAKTNGLHNTCLGEVIRGKRKTHKGFTLATATN